MLWLWLFTHYGKKYYYANVYKNKKSAQEAHEAIRPVDFTKLYLNDNNIPLIENDKLNKVFGKQPGVLKKKYGIDIKEQMLKYDFSKFSFDEDTKKGGSKNAVR